VPVSGPKAEDSGHGGKAAPTRSSAATRRVLRPVPPPVLIGPLLTACRAAENVIRRVSRHHPLQASTRRSVVFASASSSSKRVDIDCPPARGAALARRIASAASPRPPVAPGRTPRCRSLAHHPGRPGSLAPGTITSQETRPLHVAMAKGPDDVAVL
jgi:hypothetical protein